MQPNQRLSHAQCPQTPAEVQFIKSVPYLAAVGALMYLATSTRPDIAYTVGCLARFNSNPGIAHWHAVKHLLRYLKGTANYSITYAPDSSWNQKMCSVLESLGFTQSYSDASIYIYVKADVRVILPVFVDEMTFASKSAAVIDQLILELSQHFKLQDLGATTQLLGIKIDRDRSKRSITISQHQYCLDILK